MRGCRTLTTEEVTLIMKQLNVRDRVLCLTCLTFGTRVSEALSLNFGDVARNTLYVNSKKRSENQSFPIPEYYKQELEKLKEWYKNKGIVIEKDLPLFISNKGKNKSITRQLASHILRCIVRKLDLDGKIGIHSFRKTFVTKIYEMTGFNLAETKLYSRHKSLVNLEYYIKTTEKTDLIKELSWC